MTETTEQSGGESAAVETPKDDYVLHSDTVAEEAKAVEPAQEEKPSEDTTKPDSEEAPKKKGGFQKKIERLGATVAEMEAENLRLKAELEQRSSATKPKATEAAPKDGEPLDTDFDNYADYMKAWTRWENRQAIGEFAKQQSSQTQIAKKVQSYEQKRDAFKESEPEFQERVAEYEDSGLITPIVQAALLDSTPQVVFHLASNPEQAEMLARMDKDGVNRFIGRLEGKLEGQGTVKAAVKTTSSPPPINPVKSNASTTTKDPDKMSFEEYNAYRNKQERDRRGG